MTSNDFLLINSLTNELDQNVTPPQIMTKLNRTCFHARTNQPCYATSHIMQHNQPWHPSNFDAAFTKTDIAPTATSDATRIDANSGDVDPPLPLLSSCRLLDHIIFVTVLATQ